MLNNFRSQPAICGCSCTSEYGELRAIQTLVNVVSTPTMIRTLRWYNIETQTATAILLLADFDHIDFDPMAFADREWPRSIQNSVPKRQAEFFAGRWVARQVLMSLGVTATDLSIGRHRMPIWPAEITGSITHTATQVAAAALSSKTSAGFGIDLEPVVDEKLANILCAQMLDAAEHAALRDSGLSWVVAVTIAFSAKESFFKGAYSAVGEYFGFEAVRVTAIDAKRSCLRLTLVTTLSPALSCGRHFSVRYAFPDMQTVFTVFSW